MSIKKILFLTPYPYNSAPSQRFRFEQYLAILSKAGCKYQLKPFLSQLGWQYFYKGNLLIVSLFLLQGFLKRILSLFSVPFYDIVFIHREVSPIGPPIFEWIITKIFRKKVIYDFDDAIWMPDPVEKGTLLTKLKWKSKVSKICKWSYRVSVGNQFLANYALNFNNNVVINPTTIDTENLHNPTLFELNKDDSATVIGWTGTHSTLHYLDLIIPIIEKLEKEFNITFLVIANKNPEYNLKSFQFAPWDKETEIKDLMKIDIGIMPLSDDSWSQGKCGFKLLQYMALEKPVLASPIGVNNQIIQNEVNGYLCSAIQEWDEKLSNLIKNLNTRSLMGKAGRGKVINSYSVSSNKSNFLSLFEL
ncbi:glycosyltransferase [Fulvivirga sp.]|uniref:glycosyltransferase n=1 Tax=Fulvivirga sp. TaxID=1931237 RepID=UPI0032EE451B